LNDPKTHAYIMKLKKRSRSKQKKTEEKEPKIIEDDFKK
jgi:hypothetical protein